MNEKISDSVSEKRVAEIAAISDRDIDLSEQPEQGEVFFARAKVGKLRPDREAPDNE